ncbi:hypothetical protein C789_2086 [Microcystis aeruginosa FACHB-905 = DIANCHI905]|nr:hypothetical protein C789_2086 [Microcystis aeruginosa FACHB-905 = DIANCHI905]TRT98514.1 MAG: hypothetical protein EWV61_17095 [Microcystis aeruginosa Ma_AC_P_19900807_S300]
MNYCFFEYNTPFPQPLTPLWTWVGIISQPENRSVEEPDQPDGRLSKRKSPTSRRLSPYLG